MAKVGRTKSKIVPNAFFFQLCAACTRRLNFHLPFPLDCWRVLNWDRIISRTSWILNVTAHMRYRYIMRKHWQWVWSRMLITQDERGWRNRVVECVLNPTIPQCSVSVSRRGVYSSYKFRNNRHPYWVVDTSGSQGRKGVRIQRHHLYHNGNLIFRPKIFWVSISVFWGMILII